MAKTILIDPEAEQQCRGAAAWRRVAEAGLTIWIPGMEIDRGACRILAGLAPSYSLPDNDIIDQILHGLPFSGGLKVDLFDASKLTSVTDVDDYIPGLKAFYHTPVLGVWRGGVLEERRAGFAARRFIGDILCQFGAGSEF